MPVTSKQCSLDPTGLVLCIQARSLAEEREMRSPEFKDSHCSVGTTPTPENDPYGGLLNAVKSRFGYDAG